MLLVLRPAQAAGEFQIVRDVIISLAKRGVGIERVGILATEVIVTVAIEAADRIGIDIDALIDRRFAAAVRGIIVFETAVTAETFAAIGYARNPWSARSIARTLSTIDPGEDGHRIDEDVIVLDGFVVHEVSAHAEVERAGKIRCEPEFLICLPGMLPHEVFGEQLVAATELRIADEGGAGVGIPLEHALRAIGFVAAFDVAEDARIGGKAVVIARGPQEIVAEAGVRREGERGREFVDVVPLYRVALGLVDGRELGIDFAQIGGLARIGIRQNTASEGAEYEIIRQRVRVGQTEGIVAVERTHLAALAEIRMQTPEKAGGARHIGG